MYAPSWHLTNELMLGGGGGGGVHSTITSERSDQIPFIFTLTLRILPEWALARQLWLEIAADIS